MCSSASPKSSVGACICWTRLVVAGKCCWSLVFLSVWPISSRNGAITRRILPAERKLCGASHQARNVDLVILREGCIDAAKLANIAHMCSGFFWISYVFLEHYCFGLSEIAKKKSHRYLVLQKSHQSYCIIVVHPLVLVTVGWVVLFEALQWVHLHFTRLSGTGSTGSLLFFSASSPFPCNSRSHFLTFLRSFQIGGTSALLCNIGCADSSCSVNGGARRDWPGQTAVALLSKLFEQTV